MSCPPQKLSSNCSGNRKAVDIPVSLGIPGCLDGIGRGRANWNSLVIHVNKGSIQGKQLLNGKNFKMAIITNNGDDNITLIT